MLIVKFFMSLLLFWIEIPLKNIRKVHTIILAYSEEKMKNKRFSFVVFNFIQHISETFIS